MKKTATPASKRRIGWNGLTLTLPISWEVIVSGESHLLIEHDFKPVAEIRWEKVEEWSQDNIFETIRRSFATSEKDVQRISLPKPYAALAHQHRAAGFSWNGEKQLSGLLWQCAICDTVVFCHLFRHPETGSAEVASMLESVHCHLDNGAQPFWSIQDIHLTLPRSFRFSDYTFAAGLSRLAFNDGDLYLQFCRLAPAVKRLEKNPLVQLLDTLQGGLVPEEILADSPQIYECRNRPSASQRLLTRLRRQRPFRWGRIWHDAPHNRLLSVTAESVRPIDLNTVHRICAHYEIIPFTHAAIDVSQPG